MKVLSPLAIYVHIPFCQQKCAYCDFASFVGQEGNWQRYFAALHGEISAWADELRVRKARSIFFGGGTPSIVSAAYIADTLAALKESIRFESDIEITLEANPGTLTSEKLRIYRRAGVNRLSIGVQSFDDVLLRRLGRIHTAHEAAEAVYMAQDAGFDNISIDLMYALPNQSMAQWSETIDRALTLPLTHISAYSLIVEEGTRMYDWVQAGKVSVPDDDMVNEMQRMAALRFENAGFARYEISNFARAGFESRHNFSYWTGGEYLGLGSAAHSLMNNSRFENPPELSRYLAGERMLNRCERSISDRREETLMLATRTLRGLDLDAWQHDFGERLEKTKAREIKKLADYGLIDIENGFLRLTAAGLELQDSVVLELMDD